MKSYRKSRLSLFRQPGRKKADPNSSGAEGEQFFGTVKYSAAKLKERGVIVSVQDIPDGRSADMLEVCFIIF